MMNNYTIDIDECIENISDLVYIMHNTYKYIHYVLMVCFCFVSYNKHNVQLRSFVELARGVTKQYFCRKF